MGSEGTRLNSFGQPFQGNKIRGVQRKTYMGGGLDEHYANQVRDGSAATAFGANGLARRPAQATGSRAVEEAVASQQQHALMSAAARGVARAEAESAPRAITAPAAAVAMPQPDPTFLDAVHDKVKAARAALAKQRRAWKPRLIDGQPAENYDPKRRRATQAA